MKRIPDNECAASESLQFEFAALLSARNYRKAIIEEFGMAVAGHVVEVGAGIGQVSRDLASVEAITRLTCVEPNPDYISFLERAVPDAKLVCGTSADIPDDLEADCIVSVNVLEHIESDIEEMKRYRELLEKRRGRFCVFVPAGPELLAPIDRDFGHFRRYTRRELNGKLRRAGFNVEKIHYFNIVGYFAWLYFFKLLKRRCFAEKQVCAFDRLVFPGINFVERTIVRPPFGQSLLAVANVVDAS